MGFPLLGTAVSTVAGGVDGVISATDADAGRDLWYKQYATWYGGALAVAGLAGGYFGAHHEIYEPAMYVGSALLARRAGFALLERSQTKPVQAFGRTQVTPRIANSRTAPMAYKTRQRASMVG